MPHLARVHDLDALGEQLGRGLDAPDRHQLVEVDLQHLAAQLEADRQVGGELQPRPRARGVALRERQPGLAEGALELAQQVGLAHAQRRLVAGEQDLPALARLVVGGIGHLGTDGTVNRMADLLGTLKRHRLGLFVVLVGLLLAWMLWSVKGALAAFIIGVALAFVLDPLVTFLQRRGVPRWGGVLVAYAVVVGLVAAIVAYAIPPIAAQARDLISHLPQLSAAVSDWQKALLAWYESLPLPDELRDGAGRVDPAARNRPSVMPCATSWDRPSRRVLRAAGFLVGLVVIPVWLFYVLKDRERLPGAIDRALPEGWRPDAGNVLSILAGVGGSWVRGQLAPGRGRLRGHRHRPDHPHLHRLQRVRRVHPGAGADRRRAGVVPDHRSGDRRHPGDPDRPVDQPGRGPGRGHPVHGRSSSWRTTCWCRR